MIHKQNNQFPAGDKQFDVMPVIYNN